MSTVPERTLNWLYSVLTSEYHDVNRTYADVAATLSHYSSLKPRTEVYSSGSSALLLRLSGTLPVTFRGATYRFPITIWIPHAYPREAPLLYVTPVQGMVLVPGNYVGSEGRVYHRYLAQWAEYWDRSSIIDFLDILRGIFAKEAPVRTQQQDGFGQQLQRGAEPTPPPLPP
ncbi:UEV-domain-containing protein, partial [Rhizodiscina lignyota]